MRQTEDFLKLVDVVTRMRASRLPPELAEAAIRAAWEEYRIRSHDIRFIAAAERLALHPPVKEPVIAPKEATPAAPARPPGKTQAGPKAGVVAKRP